MGNKNNIKKSPIQKSYFARLIRGNAGFTLIEMLVVLAIFGLLATMVVANYAGLRGPRNLKISQNELISSIRKYQSYTLSARNLPNGNPAKFYILKFVNDEQNQNGYIVQAVDSNGTFLSSVETQKYAQGIGYYNLRDPLTMTDGLGNPVPPVVGRTTPPLQCVQVAFSLPFGRIYMEATIDTSCDIAANITSAAYLDTIANRVLTITIIDSVSSNTKSVTINAVTGAITAQ